MSPLAVIGTRHGGEVVGLRAEGGVITEVGPHVVAHAGDEVVDGTGTAVFPGLVNAHTHAAMTLLRGYGDDLSLMEWLREKVWPIEAKLTADDVYWGTRLACLEMVRAGTTTFWDMYWHPEAVARAAIDAGMRVVASGPIIEQDADPSMRAARAAVEESIDHLRSLRDDGHAVTPAIGPHAVYTVEVETLEWAADLARRRDLPIQIHVSETEHEVRECVDAHGVRPVELLDRIGVLGERCVLAHGVWLDDHELDLVAASGATIVTNPVSNLKLAVGGIFSYPRARARGIPVGLGTDGAASNNSLDLLQDVKVLALLQKHAANDPTVLPAHEAWAVATGALAPALQGTRIEVGQPADLVLVRLDCPELEPGDLVTNLVYAATGAAVDTTVVAGRVVMRGRAVGGEDEVRAEAAACARRLGVH